MNKSLSIVLVALVSLGLGMTGVVRESYGAAPGAPGSPPAAGSHTNAFLVDKIIGSKVLNLHGETLGTIGDLVVDVDTGRIVYAILDFGGFLGFEEKRFPVPWAALAALPAEGTFFLNQTKAQLEQAPAFDRKNVPNMGDLQWGEGIFKHYGARPGYDPGFTGYGSPMYPGPGREDPYKKLFDAKTITTISGQVIKVDRVPAPGVGMEMRLTILSDKKEILPVYLGPTFYVGGVERSRHFLLGDKVTVTGSQVTDRGEPVLIATTVTRRNEVLRLRDKDGNPAWVGWKTTSQ